MRIFISLLLSFAILHAYDFNTSRLATSSVSKWQDADSQIQHFIIQNDKVFKEKFFPLFNQPFSIVSEEEKAKFQIPKLNYTREDIRVVMTYTKYLIDQNRTEEIPEIYVNVIDSINRANSGNSVITLVFKIVINNLTLKSLEYDIAYLKQEEKAKLLSKTPRLFELSLAEFDATLERSIKALVGEYQSILLIDMFPKERAEKIGTALEQKMLNVYHKSIELKEAKEREGFVQKYKSDAKSFLEKYTAEVNYLKRTIAQYYNDTESLKELNQTQITTLGNVSNEVIVDMFFYTQFWINFMETREDCAKVIELNQKMIKALRHQ